MHFLATLMKYFFFFLVVEVFRTSFFSFHDKCDIKMDELKIGLSEMQNVSLRHFSRLVPPLPALDTKLLAPVFFRLEFKNPNLCVCL